MKTKLTFTILALIAGIAFFAFTDWQSIPVVASVAEKQPTPIVAPASTQRPIATAEVAPNVQPSIQYQAAYGAVADDDIQVRLEGANRFQFPALLAEMERMPESPVKTELMRSALIKWATLDGAAAAAWAKFRSEQRHFLPEILASWSETDAASAWQFAQAALSGDKDQAAWRSPLFVKTAFRGMTGTQGDGVWKELAALPDASAVHAMMGMADFASNGQNNTAFAAEVERRALDLGSAPMAAAFYAAAGHIAAAKSDLASVADGEQWHAIAREIAKQQAVLDPSLAVQWLQSQFPQPSDGIEDMVESIGMMHALNAGDVLDWLRALPESDARKAGIEKIQGRFSELRTDIPVETISLN